MNIINKEDPLSQDVANSFAPVSGKNPYVLILGTMPGQVSLKSAQYYAHPRNAFWPILISVIQQSEPDSRTVQKLPYPDRIQLACEHGYALWDVLAQCHRPGSLDSNIQQQSAIANPINEWLAQHPSVVRICFNGKTADALFNRHVRKEFNETMADRSIEFFTLPSTSPAMASLSLSEKHATWLKALRL